MHTQLPYLLPDGPTIVARFLSLTQKVGIAQALQGSFLVATAIPGKPW